MAQAIGTAAAGSAFTAMVSGAQKAASAAQTQSVINNVFASADEQAAVAAAENAANKTVAAATALKAGSDNIKQMVSR